MCATACAFIFQALFKYDVKYFGMFSLFVYKIDVIIDCIK